MTIPRTGKIDSSSGICGIWLSPVPAAIVLPVPGLDSTLARNVLSSFALMIPLGAAKSKAARFVARRVLVRLPLRQATALRV